MNFLIDAFEPAFMQRALIGGLLAVVATSLVGTWVVLRGLAFLGDLDNLCLFSLVICASWACFPK